MRLRLFCAAIVAALSVMNVGLALAGANPGNPSPPGQEKTPPGQAAKAEEQSERATPPGQLKKETTEPAPVESAPAEIEYGKPVSGEAAPSSHAKAAQDSVVVQKPNSKPAKAPKPRHDTARGNSAVAHTHVIICHRTGSKTNPYVVINISMSAWLHGHATHPDLNGHGDILLKQGAAPGEKLPRSACGSPANPSQPGPAAVVKDPTPTSGTPPSQSSSVAVPSGGGKPAGKPMDPSVPTVAAGHSGPHGDKTGKVDEGVAAHVEVAVAQELPFTGVPLWLAVFVGCLLLTAGVAIRKASWAPREAEADRTPLGRRR
jgi:hypothetical protein